MVKHLLQIELPKRNTWVSSLGSRILLILSYLFDQKVKKKNTEKKNVYPHLLEARPAKRNNQKHSCFTNIIGIFDSCAANSFVLRKFNEGQESKA